MNLSRITWPDLFDHTIALNFNETITPGSLEYTFVCVWNDEEVLERVLDAHSRDISCMVIDGAMSNMGVIQPKPGYLKRAQELCHPYKVLFYLNKTVTGFRVAPGGGELYDLQPDIVTSGKALR